MTSLDPAEQQSILIRGSSSHCLGVSHVPGIPWHGQWQPWHWDFFGNMALFGTWGNQKTYKKMGTEQPDVCEGRSECLEKPKTVFAGAFPNMTTGELIRPLSRVIYGWGRVPDQVKGPNEVKRAQCSWCSIKSAKLERAKWCCKKKGISSAINHYNDFSPCDVGIDHNSWANQSTTLAQFGQGNPPKQSSILGWLFHVEGRLKRGGLASLVIHLWRSRTPKSFSLLGAFTFSQPPM